MSIGTYPVKHEFSDCSRELGPKERRSTIFATYVTAFASRALALVEGLPIIGRLLGHRRVETTACYAHLVRDSVRESSQRVGVSIAAEIL